MNQIFDKRELLDELDGDREFLEESVMMLNSDAPAILEQLRDAIERGDAGAVAASAHTLKSMVGNFCAQAAFDAASDVEALGRSGDLTNGRTRCASLQNEITRLQEALREFLSEIE